MSQDQNRHTRELIGEYTRKISRKLNKDPQKVRADLERQARINDRKKGR